MRILGYIEHPSIKFTVFEDNNKVIVQCEDGLCQQTYKFRSGGLVDDLESIKNLFDEAFIASIENQLSNMKTARRTALSKRTTALEDEFDVII